MVCSRDGRVKHGVRCRAQAPSAGGSKPGQGSNGSAGSGEPRIGGRSLAQEEGRAAAGLAIASAGTCRTGQAAGPRHARYRRHVVAERVGFEPTKSFDSTLFKSVAINRSATSPAASDTSVTVHAWPSGYHDRTQRGRKMTSTDTFVVQRMGREEGPFSRRELQAQVRAKMLKINTAGPARRRDGDVVPGRRDPGRSSATRTG